VEDFFDWLNEEDCSWWDKLLKNFLVFGGLFLAVVLAGVAN